MSPFEPRMIQDVKLSSPIKLSDKDVEGGAVPPSYPLHETEELVVGGPENRRQRLIHWFRARRNRRRCCGATNKNGCRRMGAKVFRAIKFIFAAFVLLSLVHLIVAGITTRKAYKSLKCVAITPSELQDGLAVTIPFRRSKHIVVHPSLSGGDSLITHDESVPKGSVQFAVTFANGTKPDAVYDGCVTKIWGATVVGLIPREEHGERAKVSTFAIRVPASLSHPSVKFLGKGDKKISDKKLKKVIRWWRKQQDKKSNNNVERAA